MCSIELSKILENIGSERVTNNNFFYNNNNISPNYGIIFYRYETDIEKYDMNMKRPFQKKI